MIRFADYTMCTT